jgi:hypothetical protein
LFDLKSTLNQLSINSASFVSMYNIPATPVQQYYYNIRIQQIMHEHHVNIEEATHLLGRKLYPKPHQLALWECFVNTQGAC